MPNKKADLVRLIDNPVAVHSVHKTRQKPPDIGRERGGRKGEGSKPPPTQSIPATPPSGKGDATNPVTTVVISSSTGVHFKQPSPATDKRTGRYLAVGAITTMAILTLYNTFLRSVPVLAGLAPPALIMFLYLLWIVYFAKKRKRQMQIEFV